VAWLLEAVDDDDDDDNSTHNAHMQLLIDKFRKVYEANEGACRARDGEAAAAANATAGGGLPPRRHNQPRKAQKELSQRESPKGATV
jgi:hypothetical protein